MKHLIRKIIFVLTLFATGTSCTKQFDEMNIDPNNPTVAPATNVLARSIQSIVSALYGERLGIYYVGFYAGQTSPGTIGIATTYEYRNEIVTSQWSGLYYAMNDLQKVIAQAEIDNNKNMQAAAITLKVFAAQYATDMWGAIPYTKAFNGETGVLRPGYDSQEEVYTALIADLKKAADLFNAGSIDQLGEGDILLGGSLDKWKRFCNSLRLRVAIRISNVSQAKAGELLTEVLTKSTLYPTLAIDENIMLQWPGAAPYNEPWFTYLTGNGPWYAMSATLIDALKANNDPRLPVYAQPVPGSSPDAYAGLRVGRPSSEFSLNNVSKIGTRFGYAANGFSPLMRYSEVCFIKAEAYKRNLVAGGNAEEEYKNGVTASLKENGINTATTYLAEAGVAWTNTTADLNKIYLQKWIAIFKQSSEAWSEARRTDVPFMDKVPYEYNSSHNRPPLRYPYPDEEASLNEENIAPHLVGLDNNDRFWGKQMWWDTRTGVH